MMQSPPPPPLPPRARRSLRHAGRAVVGALLLLLSVGAALAESVTFRYQPAAGSEPRQVSLRASFNDWGETPMTLGDDGAWTVTVELEPGVYPYKFFIDGEWPRDMADVDGRPLDPTADGYVDDEHGGRNAIRLVQEPTAGGGPTVALAAADLTHAPDDPAFRSVADGRLVLRLQARAGSVAEARVTTETGASAPLLRQLWWGGKEMWRVSLPLQATVYRFEVTGNDGSSAVLDAAGEPFAFDGHDPFPTVAWVEEAVFYQIFPERFANGNAINDRFALASDESVFNTAGTVFGGPPQLSGWSAPPGPGHCCRQYFGGDLAGVIERLDALRAQGVTAIYLNPIFDSGSAHGYDTHDYLKVSPKFGSEKTLRDLLDLAHAREMKVILDFVPNHTGLGFAPFRDVVAKGPDSPYWNWYLVTRWPFEAGATDAYRMWGNAPSLPKLNTLDPEVRAYLLEVARYWIAFGADGWRVDAPGEVLGAHDFFADMRRVVKGVDPDAYLLGEIWQIAPEWLQGDAFDALMNYTVGRDVVLRYAAGGNLLASAGRTRSELSKAYAAYGENVAAMSFNLMASHDTARLLSQIGGGNLGDTPDPEALARQELASTLLYALPGAPVTFQGDDCAFLGQSSAPGTQDLQRYPLQWPRCNEAMQAHYRSLAELRLELPALTRAPFRSFDAGDAVLGFFRGEPQEPGEVLVLANNTTEPQVTTLPLGSWRPRDGGGRLRGRPDVTVPPLTVRFYVRLGLD